MILLNLLTVYFIVINDTRSFISCAWSGLTKFNMFNLKSGEFLRGSGSSYDPSKRKQRSFSFPMSGRETVTILQETALLLEPSDVTRFAEHFIDWLEKYNITGILDTHVVKVDDIENEAFKTALKAADTPAKAAMRTSYGNTRDQKTEPSNPDSLSDSKSSALMITSPIDSDKLFSYTKLLQRRIAVKTVFVDREGCLESDEIARMRTPAMLYLRTATEGGVFQHICEVADIRNHVGAIFEALMKEADVTNDIALMNLHVQIWTATLKHNNLSELYTRITEYSNRVDDISRVKEERNRGQFTLRRLLQS